MESKESHIYNIITPQDLQECVNAAVRQAINAQQSSSEKKQIAESDLMTVEETLKFLKCSKQALWNWRKNGILPSYRLGNRVYYKKSDIYTKLIKQE